jgi:hypothetical protein
VSDDIDMSNVDVFVFLNEMSAEDGSENLRRCDRMLLGGDIDGVLD